MNFKVGDKVKVVSLSNTFNFNSAGLVSLLNKTFTVSDVFVISDVSDIQLKTIVSYVAVKENSFYWDTKDLILINNNLEIE